MHADVAPCTPDDDGDDDDEALGKFIVDPGHGNLKGGVEDESHDDDTEDGDEPDEDDDDAVGQRQI